MAQFDWRDAVETTLLQRFRPPEPRGQVRGLAEWQIFIERLLSLILQPISLETYIELHRIFDGYTEALDVVQRKLPPPECCVFVSHKRCDVADAERIAWIVVQQGFDYWLDVHDPVLPHVAGAPIPSPFKETIVAAIVEMALLNATHLIAVHTPNSHTSMWVPYEIGRTKSRDIWSSQVSGWFQPQSSGGAAVIAGEYTHLMERLASKPDIDRWLASQKTNQPGCCTLPWRGWPRSPPPARNGL